MQINLQPILFKLLKKKATERANPFYEVSIILISKPGKDTKKKKKKVQASNPDGHRC